MRHFSVPIGLVLIVFHHQLSSVSPHQEEPSKDRIFLKYPSSYVNFTSDSWKLKDGDDQLIFAVSFQALAHLGQIYSIRFIRPNGSLEALLTVGLVDGNLQIDLFNSRHTKILNKPVENVPINVHEHHLALGINSTARNVWYRVGSTRDANCEINQEIDLSGTEVSITIGGGGQSIIGCVSIVAVSAGGGAAAATSDHHNGTPIAWQDVESCPAADECTTRDCNTGRCKLLEVPTCDCYGTEMSGPNCRRPSPTIQLRNNDENEEQTAYIRYTPWQPDQSVSRIAMDFKFSDSDSKEGILVYGETVGRHIFKIYVVGTKGNVVLGSENLMEFDLKPDDSRFHNIIVRFLNESVNLYVDEVVQRRHFNGTLAFKTIQFGAPIQNDVSEVGVTACVKNVYVDHYDIIDLYSFGNDSRVITTKVRPCIDEDLSEVPGVTLFSADPVVLITSVPEIPPNQSEDDEDLSPMHANLFPVPTNKKKLRIMSPTTCEKPNAYMCQNGAGCKKESDTEFTCYCRDGYIGKFCQFTTLPRSCAEAHDFLKLPNGPTWVDVDGNRQLAPSVTQCIDGETQIPHNMAPTTVVRDAGFQNHSMFVLSYRDFNTWQLEKYMKNSGHCSQTVKYRCNKAPLKFKEGRTWFKSVTNSTKKIRQIGNLEYSCPCLDTGCQLGEKCNCDSGAIAEDIGELTGRNAGISEVVALFDEADVRAEMTISELRCSGYEDQKPIRFSEKTELQVATWSGQSIDFQFRTSDTPASLVTVRGNYGEKIIGVSLLDGHTVQINHFEAVKIIGSQNKLNDSAWHHVLIELADGEIRVTVDAAHVLLTIGDNAVLEGSVLLGASTEHGLIGCVRNLLLNDESLDLHALLENSQKSGVSTNCDTHCTRDFCHNGAKCYEDFVTETAYCRCAFPDVHSGANCEIDINHNSSVSFHGGHLKFDDLSPHVLTAPVYFSFRTDRTHALLFFAHDQNNNFLQVHLSEEVNLTLTLNNLDIVSQCTVRARPGTEFGDMRWIQVAISHDAESSQLQVDDEACTIRTSRVLSQLPIQRLHDVHNSELVRLPVGFPSSLRPDPYTFIFIGNVDVGAKTNDGSLLLAPKYESPIPRFYGCLRGLQVDRRLVDLRDKVERMATSEAYEAYGGPSQVHLGCDVGCSEVHCSNGGHCAVAWTNTDPTAAVTTCDCSRTSYSGATCTLDEGVHLDRNGFIEFDVYKKMMSIFVERNPKIPQLLKFAFSAPKDESLDEKAVLASVTFREKRKLEIEINPNRTINVAISYENGKFEVLNFVGDFLDGFRHFVVVQTNQASATAVMIDSLRQDFPYRDFERNIDMFSAKTVKIGDKFVETEVDGYTKAGFEGCISNFVVDYQRGAALTYKPISLYSNPTHHLYPLISAENVNLGSCAAFEVPNSLPVYQNRVKFPVWETDFKRFIYYGDVESPDDNDENSEWTTDDSGSLFWIGFIVILLAFVFLLLFFIFMTCCRERIHAREGYPHDEDIPLNMTPSILRQTPPSPPPKQSAMSNYRIPNPNVDFNQDDYHSRATSITSSGISGYFTAQESPYDDDDDDDDEDDVGGADADDVVAVTLHNDEDSDSETIRHIDDDRHDEEDDVVVVSRPTQVQHLPQRMSSFRAGDPTAPKDSPLYSPPRKPPVPVHAPIPVPPPRMNPSPQQIIHT